MPCFRNLCLIWYLDWTMDSFSDQVIKFWIIKRQFCQGCFTCNFIPLAQSLFSDGGRNEWWFGQTRKRAEPHICLPYVYTVCCTMYSQFSQARHALHASSKYYTSITRRLFWCVCIMGFRRFCGMILLHLWNADRLDWNFLSLSSGST